MHGTGGKTQLVVSLTGEKYHADWIGADALAQLGRLGIDLGVEIYAVSQQ